MDSKENHPSTHEGNPLDEKSLQFFKDVVEYQWVWGCDESKRTSKAGG
jgi:hypothetical protein